MIRLSLRWRSSISSLACKRRASSRILCSASRHPQRHATSTAMETRPFPVIFAIAMCADQLQFLRQKPKSLKIRAASLPVAVLQPAGGWLKCTTMVDSEHRCATVWPSEPWLANPQRPQVRLLALVRAVCSGLSYASSTVAGRAAYRAFENRSHAPRARATEL